MELVASWPRKPDLQPSMVRCDSVLRQQVLAAVRITQCVGASVLTFQPHGFGERHGPTDACWFNPYKISCVSVVSSAPAQQLDSMSAAA